MASELRKAIIDADDLVREVVEVPEWGDIKIEVRSLTSGDRNRLLSAAAREGTSAIDMEKYTADLVILTAFDPSSGEKVFDKADRDMLNQKNSAAVDRLFSTAARLAGLSDNSIEKAKETFETAQSVDSSSS